MTIQIPRSPLARYWRGYITGAILKRALKMKCRRGMNNEM